MRAARVLGSGPTRAAVLSALTDLGWAIDEPARLVVVIVSGAGAGWPEGPAIGPTDPVALVQELLETIPSPGRDATGEIEARVQIVLMIEREHLVPGLGPAMAVVATGALLAWMRDATVRQGPQLRVNAVALDLAAPGDLRPVLRWMIGTGSVAGQMVTLGPLPRAPLPGRVVPKVIDLS